MLHPSYESRDFQEFSLIVQKQLEHTGLIDFLDGTQSGCVENGSQFFIELVLHDGSLIKEGEALVLDIADTFKQEHGHLRVQGVVRAHWTIGSIIYAGNCRDETGLLKSSECYKVELESGRGKQIVEIEVLPSAFEEIDQMLGVGDEFVNQVIRKLLENDLSKGGLSFWHPIRYPKKELNHIAAQAMIYEIKNPKSET